MKTNRPFYVGALLGLGFYLVCLGAHVFLFGGLRPDPGCMVEPTSYVLNAPAWIVGAVVPNQSVAPQRFGKVSGEDADTAEEHWSPAGFIVMGLVFYALLGSGVYGVLKIDLADTKGKD